MPEFYCLDHEFWRPDLEVPAEAALDPGRRPSRSTTRSATSTAAPREGRNIKSTHIYLPLIERLKAEGYDVELIFVHGRPQPGVRFYQVQADIVVDMLTFGFFGANVREAMMLGKPVVCYLRPEWLEQHARRDPRIRRRAAGRERHARDRARGADRSDQDPEKRAELGRRGREFAVRWHSADVAARRFDVIYRNLLAGRDGSDDFRNGEAERLGGPTASRADALATVG